MMKIGSDAHHLKDKLSILMVMMKFFIGYLIIKTVVKYADR